MFLKLNYIIVILLWLCLVNFTLSARILFVGIAPSLSNHIFFRHLIKELAFRGHHVVSITPYPINDPELINITEIDTHNETYSVILTTFKLFHVKDDKVLSAPKVQELIHNPNEHFDVVIVEWLLTSAHYFGFRERFNCPSIGVASLDTTINVMDAIGNSPDPNYYGSCSTEFSGGNLNFWERLKLLWHHIYFRYYYYFQCLPGSNKLLAKHFNVTNKSVWDLEKSVDLLLTNTNPIFHIPRPKVPTYIDIGGMHLADRKPLPKDLKKFLDDSKQGVILFNLGSNVQSTNIQDDTRTAILDLFRQLPFTVLWTWESDGLPDKPKNVITKSWFPQQDVLDHPNLKVFIMQGELQSIEEAIRSAVPLICVPYGTGQEFNARRIADLEIGRQLSSDDITVDTLKDAITDITTNPKYKKNIQKLSEVLWDQPTKPLDRAVWWIEYVIRHGGAKHLRSPAADLPWYKYLLLDILGFIFGVAIIGLIVIVKAIKLFLKFGLYITKKIKYKVE